MQLINEHYEGLDISKEENLVQYFFEYTVNPPDFQLKIKNMWDVIEETVQWYTLQIGKDRVTLPSNLYIMLADVHCSNVDWVRVEEINVRPLTTALYYSDLEADKYSIEEIRIVDVEELPRKSVFPNTKNLVPVLVGENRMILCSDKDSFVKTKKMNFACLY